MRKVLSRLCWPGSRDAGPGTDAVSPRRPVSEGKQPRAKGRARRVAGGVWNRRGPRRGVGQHGEWGAVKNAGGMQVESQT